MAKSKKTKISGPWLKDPKKPRDGEVIGGGWFVFRRGGGTGRIRHSFWAFEHPSREAAEAEARRLAIATPGMTFHVLGVASAFMEVGGDEIHQMHMAEFAA